MRMIVLTVLLALACGTSQAQDFPRSPKAGPPEALPEPICDTTKADQGGWMVGRWVAPHTRLEIRPDRTWTIERKGTMNDAFGWRDGTRFDGTVSHYSACTLTLAAGEGAFRFEGVLTDGGHIFGTASNPQAEQTVRLTFRRER